MRNLPTRARGIHALVLAGCLLAIACSGNSNSGDSVAGSDAARVTETAKLAASDGDVGHRFGSAVSVSGDKAILGASFGTSRLGASVAYLPKYSSV